MRPKLAGGLGQQDTLLRNKKQVKHLISCYYCTNCMNAENKLIAVARTSKRGTSIRITLPKEITKILDVEEKEHVGFYEENGKVWVRKVE